MKTFHLRTSDPERDFAEIAALISSQEDETTSEIALKEDYEKNKGERNRNRNSRRGSVGPCGILLGLPGKGGPRPGYFLPGCQAGETRTGGRAPII